MALVVGALVVAFALGEAAARVFLADELSIRFMQRAENSRRMDRMDVASIMQNDAELFWRLKPSSSMPESSGWARGTIANAQGLREDHEIAIPKPAGQIRLLFVGDSCTFGSGLLLEEGYVDRLERRLRARFPGRDIECIDAGVPGYTVFQGWRFLETRGFDLQPDLVVVTFGFNEQVPWDGVSDIAQYEHDRAATPPSPLDGSRLLRRLWSAFAAPPAAGEKRPRLTPQEYADVLLRVRRATRKRGIDLAVMVWPGRFNVEPQNPPDLRTPYQVETLAFGSKEVEGGAIDLIGLFQSLRPEHSVDDLFLDMIHATPLANAAIAERLEARLAPWIEGIEAR